MIPNPFFRPPIPPDTPQSTKCSPRWASAAWRRLESWKLAFPPSTTASPPESTAASSSIIVSVGSPPGGRGGGSRGRAMALGGREVPSRLRVDERAEGVALAGDGQVRGVAGYELEEPAGPRSALVELAGRMQVARPVADGGGPFRGIAAGAADPSQRRATR